MPRCASSSSVRNNVFLAITRFFFLLSFYEGKVLEALGVAFSPRGKCQRGGGVGKIGTCLIWRDVRQGVN